MDCGINQSQNCSTLVEFDEEIGLFAPIWCTIIAIIGFASNLLTLFAIPFAAKRKKFVLFFLIIILLYCDNKLFVTSNTYLAF